MATKIRFILQSQEFIAELNTGTAAKALLEQLPFEGIIDVWGDEISVRMDLPTDKHDKAAQIVNEGSIVYWREGGELLLLFGNTPISLDNRPKLTTPCTFVGQLRSWNYEETLRAGEVILIESLSNSNSPTPEK